jgi:hypothetical protein
MLISRTIQITSFATVLALCGPALAQERPAERASYEPREAGLTLGLDVGWNADNLGGADLQVLSPTISARLELRKLELEFVWPLVYLDVSGDLGDSTFLSGNPFVGAHLVHASEQGVFRLGAGVAIPVANIDGRAGRLFGFTEGLELDGIAYGYARAIRGSWDAWLYYPDQFAFVVPAQFERELGLLVLGAEGAAALLVPIDRSVDETTDLMLQAAGSLALRAGVLTAGLRLQAVWGPTSDGDAQLAGVPFVQADFGRGSFAYARFLLNLDEPLGFFGDGAELWGIFVGAGGRL